MVDVGICTIYGCYGYDEWIYIKFQESQKPFPDWNLLYATWFWVMLDENVNGGLCGTRCFTPRKINIAMENPPFEDVFPIQDGDFPLLCLFTGG